MHCQIPKVIIVENASDTFQAMSGVYALSILTTSGKTQHSQWEKSNIRENKKFTLNITHAMNIESDEQKNRKREREKVERVYVSIWWQTMAYYYSKHT